MFVWLMMYTYNDGSISTIAIRLPHIGVAVLGAGDDAAGAWGDVNACYGLVVAAQFVLQAEVLIKLHRVFSSHG